MKEGKKMNRKILSLLLSLLMCVAVVCSLCACDTESEAVLDQTEVATQVVDPLWENATYTENISLGEGEKSIEVDVKAGEKAITITINTDAENLEDALLGVELIQGEEGAYGLYIKTVNGILADYDVDKSYWAFYKDGKYLTSSAKDTSILSGDSFELVYTK
ncbi:MAG: DUF4430 domain-containing protein [Ruminococcus sp.]|nr:DUF4430 domain-containing protein [Ruminococcus sp.]